MELAQACVTHCPRQPVVLEHPGHVQVFDADQRRLACDLSGRLVMGISPQTEFEVERRPFYATEDGKGAAVRELFA